ncbi:hypothetical protein FAIPA1_50226 [Frankia sp. AiPs1]
MPTRRPASTGEPRRPKATLRDGAGEAKIQGGRRGGLRVRFAPHDDLVRRILPAGRPHGVAIMGCGRELPGWERGHGGRGEGEGRAQEVSGRVGWRAASQAAVAWAAVGRGAVGRRAGARRRGVRRR